ncbi:hypothetical protein Trydic_g11715 [Trypoxylus dichotomus]
MRGLPILATFGLLDPAYSPDLATNDHHLFGLLLSRPNQCFLKHFRCKHFEGDIDNDYDRDPDQEHDHDHNHDHDQGNDDDNGNGNDNDNDSNSDSGN